ncbi:hypothetical protein TIFTF001_035219 [Ficus carica]|uniref:Uncharacterized protein n=1 Tax=Ficus carica TaxID=3494 RepID=A0AA88JBH9_FICCA|nr:hypothetical protein TIFTF001_035219 [Ficus carica]
MHGVIMSCRPPDGIRHHTPADEGARPKTFSSRSFTTSLAVVHGNFMFKSFKGKAFRSHSDRLRPSFCEPLVSLSSTCREEQNPVHHHSDRRRKFSDLPLPPIRFLCLFGQTEDHLKKSTPEMSSRGDLREGAYLRPFLPPWSTPVTGSQTSQLFDPVDKF